MTREEVINHFEAQAQCKYNPTREAAELAVAALRAQQVLAQPDRSRWEGSLGGAGEGNWRSRMNRMTSDNTFEMNMCQLALNQVCIKDGWAWYRNGPEDELSVCDLIRSAAETLGVDLPMLNDDDLSDLMADWLQYGADEPEGVLAILYRALWAMAEVRARLAAYEDTGMEPEEITALIPPPNDSLTLEELREMDGEPAWIEYIPSPGEEPTGFWALVSVDKGDNEIFLLNSLGGSSSYEEAWADIRAIYRRKPEVDGR